MLWYMTKAVAHTDIQNILTVNKKTHLYCAGGSTQAQVAHRSCGVSPLEILKPWLDTSVSSLLCLTLKEQGLGLGSLQWWPPASAPLTLWLCPIRCLALPWSLRSQICPSVLQSLPSFCTCREEYKRMPVHKCLLAVFYLSMCCAASKTVKGFSSGIPESFGKVCFLYVPGFAWKINSSSCISKALMDGTDVEVSMDGHHVFHSLAMQSLP